MCWTHCYEVTWRWPTYLITFDSLTSLSRLLITTCRCSVWICNSSFAWFVDWCVGKTPTPPSPACLLVSAWLTGGDKDGRCVFVVLYISWENAKFLSINLFVQESPHNESLICISLFVVICLDDMGCFATSLYNGTLGCPIVIAPTGLPSHHCPVHVHIGRINGIMRNWPYVDWNCSHSDQVLFFFSSWGSFFVMKLKSPAPPPFFFFLFLFLVGFT